MTKKATKKRKQHFIHLHTHCEASCIDGFGQMSSFIDHAIEQGYPAIGFTDHGTMRGAFDLQTLTEGKPIKPIFGSEIYLCSDMTARGLEEVEVQQLAHLKGREKNQAIYEREVELGLRERFHLTVMAGNATGLRNMFRITSAGWLHGFYKRPRVTLELLAEHSKGVIAFTGCAAGAIASAVLRNDIKTAKKRMDILHESFKGRLFVELMAHPGEMQVTVNKAMLKFAKHYKLPVITTQDAHYVHKHDAKYQEVLLCILGGNNPRSQLANPFRFKFQSDEFWLKGRAAIEETYRLHHPYIDEDIVRKSLDNTLRVAEACTAKLQLDPGELLIPRAETPEGVSEWDWIKELCRRGWKERRIRSRVPATAKELGISEEDCLELYRDRLKMELQRLKETGFVRYMLLTTEMIAELKARGVFPGAGRGSSAGSFVSFLLGITHLDPIYHRLLFERFLAPGRCLPPGSPVLTDIGEVPIESIKVGMRVWTRAGWKPVLQTHSRKTHPSEGLISLRTRTGGLQSTPEHPILCLRGNVPTYVPAKEVERGDRVAVVKMPSMSEHSSVVPKRTEEVLQPGVHEGISGWTGDCDVPSVREGVRSLQVSESEVLLETMQGRIRVKAANAPETKTDKASVYVPVVQEEVQGARPAEILLTPLRTQQSGKQRLQQRKVGVSRGSRSQLPVIVGSGFCAVSEVVRNPVPVRTGTVDSTVWGGVHPRLLPANEESIRGTQGIPEAGLGQGPACEDLLPQAQHQVQSCLSRYILEEDTEDREAGVDKIRTPTGSPVPRIGGGGTDLRGMRSRVLLSTSQEEPDLRSRMCESPQENRVRQDWQKVLSWEPVTEVSIVEYDGPVFDLTVADQPEFVSHCIVHNSDAPDIDIDIESVRRYEMIQWAIDRWGPDYVAQITTIGRMEAKAAVADVARVMQIPMPETRSITKMLETGGQWGGEHHDVIGHAIETIDEVREYSELYPPVMEAAKKMEGHLRYVGIHPAGVVISSKPLLDLLPLELRGKSPVTAFDMNALQRFGLLKWDFLGLRTLSMMSATAKAMEARGFKVPQPADLDLTDERTLQAFCDGDMIGIFQSDTSSFISMTRGFPFRRFADVAALFAANRPGATRSGLADQYLNLKKRGKRKKVHKIVDDICSSTAGIMLYQEQLQEIFRRLAGYSVEKADEMRRAVSKKKGDEVLSAERDTFIAGAMANGMDEKTADEMITAIKFAGSYLFNASHAAAYAHSAFFQQWMKVRCLPAFIYGILRYEKGAWQLSRIVTYARRRGVRIRMGDVQHPNANEWFLAPDDSIVGSLSEIKFVGPGAVEAIKELAPFESILDFFTRVPGRASPKRAVRGMIACEAFGDLLPDNPGFFLDNFEEWWESASKVRSLRPGRKRSEHIDRLRQLNERAAKAEKWSDRQLSKVVAEYSSISSYNPAADMVDSSPLAVELSLLSEDIWDKSHAWVAARITDIRFQKKGDFYKGPELDDGERGRRGFGKQLVNLNVEDLDGNAERVRMEPETLDRYRKIIGLGIGTAVMLHVQVNVSTFRSEDGVKRTVRALVVDACAGFQDSELIGDGWMFTTDHFAGHHGHGVRFPEPKRSGTKRGIVAMPTEVHTKNDKNGQEMAFIGMIDEYGDFAKALMFASVWGPLKKKGKQPKVGTVGTWTMRCDRTSDVWFVEEYKHDKRDRERTGS